MKLSIAVPSYNYARYIEACLSSIQQQNHREFEVLIADGGSQDGSLEIIRRYCETDIRFMLVSTDAVALLDTALELLAAAEKYDDFPPLRIGLAHGSAVSRAGDWFGSPVNVASRVTSVARPDSVLVAETARQAIGSADGFAWSFAGARRLKGVKGDTKLFRARRSSG